MFQGIALVLFVIIIIASKFRVPFIVIAIFAGILFGSDMLGMIKFYDFESASKIASYALVFVLFIAGFSTKKDKLKLVLAPAMTLATFGVIITAGVVAILLKIFLQLDIMVAILIGCIIASTDAAAVFSILRTRSFDPKLSSMVEIESATNDPMGIVLTTIVIGMMVSMADVSFGQGQIIGNLLWQIIGGGAIGLLIGWGVVFLSRFVAKLDKEYFYVYLIAVIMFSYGTAEYVGANGILSAFFAGFMLGNSNIPNKAEANTLFDAIATIGNVVIFVMLGLLVSPKEFTDIWLSGIVLFVILTFVARPVSVWSSTFFTKNTAKEKLFICWGGIRGAVPMVLATYPAAAGLDDNRFIFNTVFFAVLLSLLIQGVSITKIADKLKLTV
ncbi:MAG: potassium/proton antiporter [Candidatus Cloacimonetes bacterium]|nr:potassium/proton antiporter [Candidatus Cloacimonadota bacterium]